jgi:hypothetical protein
MPMKKFLNTSGLSIPLCLWKSFNTSGTFRVTAFRDTLENLWKMQCIEERNTGISLLPILFACEINIKFNSMFFFFDENILYFFFFLQVWLTVLLCRRTPTYYGRIVVKIVYTPAPIKKNCAVFKNVCIHQCVQRCVYMYIVRTRFYTNFYIVSKRKHNDQFSLKGLKKNVRFRFNKNCKNVHLKIGIQSRHTKTLFG